MRRRLSLRKERLAELSTDELATLGGGAPPCTGTSHPFPTRDLRCIVVQTPPSLNPYATCVIA